METEIEGIEFIQYNSINTSEYNLSMLFSVLAVISLIVGLAGAFIFGFARIDMFGNIVCFDDFNPALFLGLFLGGVFSFAVLKALSLFVKVAYRYLNK